MLLLLLWGTGRHWPQLLQRLPICAAWPLKAVSHCHIPALGVTGREAGEAFCLIGLCWLLSRLCCSGEKTVVLTEASSRLGQCPRPPWSSSLYIYSNLSMNPASLFVLMGFSLALSITVSDCSSKTKPKGGYAGYLRDSIFQLVCAWLYNPNAPAT